MFESIINVYTMVYMFVHYFFDIFLIMYINLQFYNLINYFFPILINNCIKNILSFVYNLILKIFITIFSISIPFFSFIIYKKIQIMTQHKNLGFAPLFKES